MPSNKEVALKRLMKLKNRLKADSKYWDDYFAFMSDIISQGHAEKFPQMRSQIKMATYDISLTVGYAIPRNLRK